MIRSDYAGGLVVAAVGLVLAGCASSDLQNIEAARLGVSKTFTVDLAEGVTLKAVLIPAGTFTMGGPPGIETADRVAAGAPHPHPPHEVTISRCFYLGVAEVTNRQFRRFLADSGHTGQAEFEFRTPKGERFYSKPPPIETGKWPEADQPAVFVTWHTAEAFCTWLSKRTTRTVRLPTEAEWEYAARAGTSGEFHFGVLGNRPWFEWTRAKGELPLPGGRYRTIAPTRAGYLRRANPWGLHDMLGNVREYCSDWFAPLSAAPRTDPTGPERPSQRGRPSHVIRGASANESVVPCYVRHYQLRPGFDRHTGFRVVIELPAAEPAAPAATRPAPSAPIMPDPVWPGLTPTVSTRPVTSPLD